MQPYNFKFVSVLLVAAAAYFLNTLLPKLDFFIFDIAYRSTTVISLFGGVVYLLKLVPDINDIINNILKKLKLVP
ncbi:MAG: hypothetical protein AAFN93_25070 [Bacteroidota bacterium]